MNKNDTFLIDPERPQCSLYNIVDILAVLRIRSYLDFCCQIRIRTERPAFGPGSKSRFEPPIFRLYSDDKFEKITPTHNPTITLFFV